MLNLKAIYKLQSDYSVSEGGMYNDNEMQFVDYVSSCRQYIHNNLPEGYTSNDMDEEEKGKHMIKLIHEFVSKYTVKVVGYVTSEGVSDVRLLSEDLVDYITGLNILKKGWYDPDVDEFQINDKNTIYVSKNGVLSYYVDDNGRPLQFYSDEEMRSTLNRIIDDGLGNIPQFTDGNPILNAKAAKTDYRINAVHHSMVTRGFAPHDFATSAVVIRKFKEVKLTLDDLVKSEAMTEDMCRFIKLASRSGVRLFCVGPTGSGKTTLLQGVLNSTPLHKRVLLAQNPTELTLMDRDEYGRQIRNVVHMQVTNKVAMDAIVSNKLRQSPEISVVGEAREPEEFYQMRRMLMTGHQVLGSYHAENSVDAVERFASEVSTTGSIDDKEAKKSVSNLLDIVITQLRFDDGRRRIIEIAEILDADADGKINANILFKFQPTGEVIITESGLRDTKGVFKQVGYMSQGLVDKFFLKGASREELEGFIAPSEGVVS